jgi:hypothetical protein
MRKTDIIEIEAEGRDLGKAFLITEMSADRQERWAMRAGFALMNSGADFSELNGESMSMQQFAKIGLSALSKIPFEAAEPLIKELMTCVEIIPDTNKLKVTRALIDGDIEEVGTLFAIKKAVWNLHIGFFISADQSTSE